MKKETAIEWLEKDLKSYIEYPLPIRTYEQIIHPFFRAKKLERRQMEQIYEAAWRECMIQVNNYGIHGVHIESAKTEFKRFFENIYGDFYRTYGQQL